MFRIERDLPRHLRPGRRGQRGRPDPFRLSSLIVFPTDIKVDAEMVGAGVRCDSAIVDLDLRRHQAVIDWNTQPWQLGGPGWLYTKTNAAIAESGRGCQVLKIRRPGSRVEIGEQDHRIC